jgi:hypothetical protein
MVSYRVYVLCSEVLKKLGYYDTSVKCYNLIMQYGEESVSALLKVLVKRLTGNDVQSL